MSNTTETTSPKLGRLEVKAKLEQALALIEECFANADQSAADVDFHDVFMHMQTTLNVDEALSVAIGMLETEDEG